MEGETDANVDGGQEQSWLSSVPENLRTHEAFKGIDKSSDAWQQFVDLKVKSANSIQIPGENATDDEKTNFYKTLGVPESADGYELADLTDLPEGTEYNPEAKKVFQQILHDAQIPAQNAAKFWDSYTKAVIANETAQKNSEKEALDAAINELKDEWKGDEFKVNTELATRTFMKYFADDDKAKEFMEETKIGTLPIGSHPMFLKIFAKVAGLMSDDSGGDERGGDGNPVSDEEKAKSRFKNTTWRN